MSSKPRPKRDRSKEAEENQTAATDIAEMDVEEMRNALIAERNKTQALEAEKVAQQLATAEREAERTKAEKASRAADNERMALLERKVEVLTSGKEKESPEGRPPYKTQDQPKQKQDILCAIVRPNGATTTTCTASQPMERIRAQGSPRKRLDDSYGSFLLFRQVSAMEWKAAKETTATVQLAQSHRLPLEAATKSHGLAQRKRIWALEK